MIVSRPRGALLTTLRAARPLTPVPPVPFEHEGSTMLSRTVGDGPDTPVVLVHGIGLGRGTLRGVGLRLARRGRATGVELPGFGSTPRQRPLLRIADQARVLAAYLHDRDDGPFVLVGHSMGAAVVAELAAEEPSLVERLVLVGPVTDPAGRSVLRAALRLAVDATREPPRTLLTVLQEYAQCGPIAYLRALPDVLRFDLDSLAPRITAPTLLLRGARDPMSPAGWNATVARRFPDARVADVRGGAHIVLHAEPAAVARAIQRFLQGEQP